MKENILNKDDFKRLKRLINISFSVEDLYNKLYNLEIEGKKESDEYNKFLEYLEAVNDIETWQYDDKDLTSSKCNSYIDYLNNYKMSSDSLSDFDSIINQEYDEICYRRVIWILSSKVSLTEESKTSILSSTINSNIGMGTPDPIQIMIEKAENFMIIERKFDTDWINTYLTILQEYIDKEEYYHLRKELIKTKYYISFLNKEIGNNMIKSKFNITPPLYFNSNLFAELFQIDLDSYRNFKSYYGIEKIETQLLNILDISDLDYNDHTKTVTSILSQCALRTSLLFVDDDNIKKLNTLFRELILKETYLEHHFENKISEYLVNQCFNNLEEDKSKLNILSLRLQ